MTSPVHRVITKKTLLLGLPRDYLAALAAVVGLLFFVGWYFLYLPSITGQGAVYLMCFIVTLLGWGIGAVKAKADPEFLSVHLAKLRIPTRSSRDALLKYKNNTDIQP